MRIRPVTSLRVFQKLADIGIDHSSAELILCQLSEKLPFVPSSASSVEMPFSSVMLRFRMVRRRKGREVVELVFDERLFAPCY